MILRTIKSRLAGRLRAAIGTEAILYDSSLLQGRMASWRVRSMHSVETLQEVEFKVFSQWGEDGIIDWMIERAAIPSHLHTFVEFGVESYREANTRFLLENRNWRGLVMDGDPELANRLKRDSLFWKFDLTAKSAFITRENVNELIREAGFSGEIGLLSVDIDGVDYWIWEAINVVQPIICICEYNALFGDLHAISVPYDAEFTASGRHFSYLYAGASIAAIRLLAEKKGYRFLGTTLAGNDAFFIRNDYAHLFEGMSPLTFPSKARGSRDEAGKLSYVGGASRFKMISHLPVVRIETGETVKLQDLGPVYSNEWVGRMGNI